jgi:hypothetical protein
MIPSDHGRREEKGSFRSAEEESFQNGVHTLFEKTPILQAFQSWDYEITMPSSHNQLMLFE